MKTLIYQSPKATKARSAPVREDETTRRAILERAGWRVVLEFELDEAPALPDDEWFDWTQIDGVGPAQRDALYRAGFTTLTDLALLDDLAELGAIDGIGPATIERLAAALAAAIGAPEEENE